MLHLSESINNAYLTMALNEADESSNAYEMIEKIGMSDQWNRASELWETSSQILKTYNSGMGEMVTYMMGNGGTDVSQAMAEQLQSSVKKVVGKARNEVLEICGNIYSVAKEEGMDVSEIGGPMDYYIQKMNNDASAGEES
jgi:hypothetical protein